MRTLNKFLTIGAMAFLFMLMAPHKSMAQGYVSNQEFYDNLQDYGTWVQDEEYGDVWIPDVDGDFRPYATNGYWAQTDYGTTWVSDYPWGWATFHYGRWRFDDYYGWEWIPGNEWAPAWVTWRQGGGYYGWAPMQPGITLDISFGRDYSVPDNYWVCAPQAYINSRYINRYYIPGNRTVTIIRRTTYIHNTYVYNNRSYIAGPRARDIERITRRKIVVYKIGNADRPGAARFNRNVVNFYRPVVKVTADARPRVVVNSRAYREENPRDGIAKRGVTMNIRANAAKLAAAAKSGNPKVVRVNPVPTHPALPGDRKNIGPVTPDKPNESVHPGAPGNHRNEAPANPGQQQPAADNKNPRKVAPAVMPPADHHDPTIRQSQPAEQQKQQGNDAAKQQQQQAAKQARDQNQQAPQQQKQQQQEAAKQAREQRQQDGKQQKEQAVQQKQQQQQEAAKQARQQAQPAAQPQRQQQQQAEQQQKEQARQQAQQAAQQQRQQQQQAEQQQKEQARQQAQQAAQQQRQQQQQAEQQQKEQARQQAQQAAQQQKQQQQQAEQQQKEQARQQAQQAAQQQKQQQQQAQQQARQQAAQQQRQQQQAAQKAAREAAQKQKQDEKKQQTPPPGN